MPFLDYKIFFMKDFSFSLGERLILLEVLCDRRDFIMKLIPTLDSVRDSKLIELYNRDLSYVVSILNKLGYE